MDENIIGMVLIVLACFLVLGIGLIKRKAEWIFRFFIRSVLGVVGILILNKIFLSMGYPIHLGINLLTILTSGILGFPGVIALYAIQIYNLL